MSDNQEKDQNVIINAQNVQINYNVESDKDTSKLEMASIFDFEGKNFQNVSQNVTIKKIFSIKNIFYGFSCFIFLIGSVIFLFYYLNEDYKLIFLINFYLFKYSVLLIGMFVLFLNALKVLYILLKYVIKYFVFIFIQTTESNTENKNMLSLFFSGALAILIPVYSKSLYEILFSLGFINVNILFIIVIIFFFLMASFSFSIIDIENNKKAIISMLLFIAGPTISIICSGTLLSIVHNVHEIWIRLFLKILLGICSFVMGYFIMYALNRLACEINDSFKFFTTIGVFIVGVSSILGAIFAYQALHQPAVQPITIQTNGSSTVVGKYNITIQPENKKH